MTADRMHPWRSLLFVPADRHSFIEKAHLRGADAVILDLEDAIAPAAKRAARDGLPGAVATLQHTGTPTVVRINADPDLIVDDITAAVTPGVTALMIPKVESSAELIEVDTAVTLAERRAGLTAGSIGVIALIESPSAVFAGPAIAAAPRVIGLALGGEDLGVRLGVTPSVASLSLAAQWIALAAATRSIMALGIPDSLANFTDLDRFAHAAGIGRAIGLTGVLCIHPRQVAAVNRAYGPDEAELRWAAAVDRRWSARDDDTGSIEVDGAMVDRPIALRARRLLEGAQHD